MCHFRGDSGSYLINKSCDLSEPIRRVTGQLYLYVKWRERFRDGFTIVTNTCNCFPLIYSFKVTFKAIKATQNCKTNPIFTHQGIINAKNYKKVMASFFLKASACLGDITSMTLSHPEDARGCLMFSLLLFGISSFSETWERKKILLCNLNETQTWSAPLISPCDALSRELSFWRRFVIIPGLARSIPLCCQGPLSWSGPTLWIQNPFTFWSENRGADHNIWSYCMIIESDPNISS